MNKIDETLDKIREVEKRLLELDRAYEKEENEKASDVIWHKKERLETRLDKLIDQADKMREGEKPEDPEDPEKPEDPKDPEDPEDPEKPEDPKDPEDPEDPEDETVCPECGSDLEKQRSIYT
jgi:hypothetical protein